MIARYTRKDMGKIWKLENKLNNWLKIEILTCEILADKGLIPQKSYRNIKKNARFSLQRIAEIEKTTKHDLISFLTSISEYVGEDSAYLHLGITSSDILDTGLAMQMKEAGKLILTALDNLCRVLKKRAYEFKYTLMIGRSHGIHAEPITFGLKLALWYAEIRRNIKRMENARENISYGKLSGAVGTFAHLDPEIEKLVLKKCGLKSAPISSQIIQRDRHAEYMFTLALIASSIEKFSTEIRHLQRTEVLEVEENFTQGQKGSSAMPHKRNPITAEQLCGLARIVRVNSLAALENIPLWHERDISHSSVERVIIPDSSILVDYLLHRFSELVKNLLVYPLNMEKNLNKMQGLFFSQRILLELCKRGVSREKAYLLVQTEAMKVWQSIQEGKEKKLKDLFLQNSFILKILGKKTIVESFEIKYYLKNVDKIFKRVFTKDI